MLILEELIFCIFEALQTCFEIITSEETHPILNICLCLVLARYSKRCGDLKTRQTVDAHVSPRKVFIPAASSRDIYFHKIDLSTFLSPSIHSETVSTLTNSYFETGEEVTE